MFQAQTTVLTSGVANLYAFKTTFYRTQTLPMSNVPYFLLLLFVTSLADGNG